MALAFTPVDERPEWATETQSRYLAALEEHGSYDKAAKALGVAKNAVWESINRYKKEAARRGRAPGHFDDGVAPGFSMVGATIQRIERDENGKMIGQTWERQKPEDEAVKDMVRDAIAAFFEAPVNPAPFAYPDPCSDVVPWIQIGDAHIGMLAHEAEAGADFNVEIAQREICAAFKLLIDQIEPCERIVVNDLGDRDHVENTEKLTARSRVPLDAQRPRLMIRTSSKVMRFVIDLALTKARFVDVIINQGNHSRFGDLYMNELLQVAYAPCGRVNVIDNESVFIGYRMGKTLVMTHHSDRCPIERLAGVMMSDFKQDFAETTFHYIDIGHIHHKTATKERDGIVIESWNTLARGDKWHKESGYRARQSMSVVFRSRTYGDIGRRTVPIQMVYDAIRRGHDAEGVSFIPQERRAYAA